MPSWEGKSKGSPLGYRIFVWVLRTMGVTPAYGLLRVVAGWYFLFSKPVLYKYFRYRIGYGRMRALSAMYRNYYAFGQTLIDKVVLMSGIKHRFTFDFDGEEHLRAMTGSGGLLLSGHIGNWEIAGHLLQRLETRIHILMYDAEHERIKAYLTSVTGERRANIIVIKDDLSHIYAVSDALAAGDLVCIHADRFVPGAKTATAQFLGAAAPFPVGPFQLAAALKVPVSFVYALKERPTHYHFFASAPRVLSRDVLFVDFVESMEKKVRQYPEQWYNYFNFWRP